jgi:hypothetical protein
LQQYHPIKLILFSFNYSSLKMIRDTKNKE